MKRRTILLGALFLPGLVRSDWIDPQTLKPGPTYVLSRITPIMPAPELPKGASVEDLIAALQRGKQLPAGHLIRVEERRNVRGALWYRAFAYTPAGALIGEGWISSAALMGQSLQHWEKAR
jgi:hypothetical protein